MSENNKIVTPSYINTILRKLYDWMPLKRKKGGIVQNVVDENGNLVLNTTNENELALGQYNVTDSNTILSIGIGDKFERKNAIKITKDGEIFIITNINGGSAESLQHVLDKKGVDIYDNYSDMLKYMNSDYIGKCLYLKQDSTYNNVVYPEGLYIVSIDATDNIILSKIGDSLNNDLSNYYTKEEVNDIISNIVLGDTSDIYYTKDDIDDMLGSISERLESVEDFIDEPILINDLELIIKKDLNNDGNIG